MILPVQHNSSLEALLSESGRIVVNPSQFPVKFSERLTGIRDQMPGLLKLNPRFPPIPVQFNPDLINGERQQQVINSKNEDLFLLETNLLKTQLSSE